MSAVSELIERSEKCGAGKELLKVKNEITMLINFNRENVVEILDRHISELRKELDIEE